MAGRGILGRVANKSYPRPGGVSVQLDGVLVANAQDTFDLDNQVPGISYGIADDAGNDRTNLTPAANGMRMLAEGIELNALSVASTPLYTVPGGLSLVVEAVVLRCLNAVSITGPATAQVTGGAGIVFQSQILTGLTEAGLFYLFPQGGSQVVVPAAGVVSVQIDVAAVGTSQTLAADLIGRLF